MPIKDWFLASLFRDELVDCSGVEEPTCLTSPLGIYNRDGPTLNTGIKYHWHSKFCPPTNIYRASDRPLNHK